MNKNDLAKHSDPVVYLYTAIENKILINVADLITRDAHMVDIDNNATIEHWRLDKLNSLGTLREKHLIMIAKHAQMTVEEVSIRLMQAGYTAVDDIEKGFKPADGVPHIDNSEPLKRIIDSYVQQAISPLNLINANMLISAEQLYVDNINLITAEILTGNTNLQDAMAKSIKNINDSGLIALIDKQGNRWKPDVYANTVIRSTINNTANAMQDTRFKEYGVDLCQVTAHGGARPLCAPYQGRIYSISGKSDKYPSLGSTSMGQPAGLFGINCGHFKFPYYEGSKPNISKEDLARMNEDNDIVYKQSQQQRHLERNIRKHKRELEMMSKTQNTQAIKEAKENVREAQKSIRAFIDETGRTRRPDREKLY